MRRLAATGPSLLLQIELVLYAVGGAVPVMVGRYQLSGFLALAMVHDLPETR